MSRHQRTTGLIAAVAILIFGGTAHAQFGGGRGGLGLRSLAMLAGTEAVQNELGLSGDEAVQVQRIAEKHLDELRSSFGAAGLARNAFQPLQGLGENERVIKLQEIVEKRAEIGRALDRRYLPEIEQALGFQRFERLKQIHRQLGGGQVLAEPELIQTLELSKEQQQTIAVINQDYGARQLRLYADALVSGGDFDAVALEVEDLRDERDSKATAALTADQQEKYRRLRGKPFDLVLLEPTRQASAPVATRLDAAESGEARVRGWREDLDLLAAVLSRKHKNAFLTLQREQFDEAVSRVKERIPELADHQILVEFLRLAAMPGDGHTTIQPGTGARRFRRLPIVPVWTRDGLFVAAAAPAHRELLRSRITDVGSLTLDQAISRLAQVHASDNASARMDHAARDLISPEVLHALGVTDDPEHATLTVTDGRNQERVVRLDAVPPAAQRKLVYAFDDQSKEAPISRRLSRELYGWEWLASSKSLYCWYDSCANIPGRPVSAWCKDVLTQTNAHPVERMIIDLRRNGGGNSLLAQPLILGLLAQPKINQKGKLFVLIGRGTYSSATDNALELRNLTQAVLIGSPTGGSPNSFGEVKYADLPHSQWQVQYSTRYFKLTSDGADTVPPDLEVEWTAAEHFDGRDPVLEAALQYTP